MNLFFSCYILALLDFAQQCLSLRINPATRTVPPTSATAFAVMPTTTTMAITQLPLHHRDASASLEIYGYSSGDPGMSCP
ncbi:hypothetical protein B0O99DRAFT_630995 [Bisporella sp. PMI_857]|nr:hypothetical protein B0O99DRAFT_630995 [Bisporella sp. PMI_857]